MLCCLIFSSLTEQITGLNMEKSYVETFQSGQKSSHRQTDLFAMTQQVQLMASRDRGPEEPAETLPPPLQMDQQVNPLERDHALAVVLPWGLEKNATVHGRWGCLCFLISTITANI